MAITWAERNVWLLPVRADGRFDPQRLADAQNDMDLPDFLAVRIFRIIENQDRFRTREGEIDDLAEKVANYDTYGQTGYLGMVVNNVNLGKTLNRLEG